MSVIMFTSLIHQFIFLFEKRYQWYVHCKRYVYERFCREINSVYKFVYVGSITITLLSFRRRAQQCTRTSCHYHNPNVPDAYLFFFLKK